MVGSHCVHTQADTPTVPLRPHKPHTGCMRLTSLSLCCCVCFVLSFNIIICLNASARGPRTAAIQEGATATSGFGSKVERPGSAVPPILARQCRALIRDVAGPTTSMVSLFGRRHVSLPPRHHAWRDTGFWPRHGNRRSQKC